VRAEGLGRRDAKRTAVLKLLERMKAAGTPVDALGIQAHLVASHFPFSPAKLRGFMAEVAAMDLQIQITELDSTDEFSAASIPQRDQQVADEYRRFLDVALEQPAVKVLVTWGLSDRHSWIASEARSVQTLCAKMGYLHARCHSMRRSRPSPLGPQWYRR
jgi:endo-1,4-beta-xylanase